MKNFLNEIEFQEYEKDIKVNLSNILMNTSKLINDDLMAATVYAIIKSKNKIELANSFVEHAKEHLNDNLIFGANAAVKIMAMNNIYYRGKHFLGQDYNQEKAGLRMTIYSNHGINKEYFEFISLAVSFINGCEFCVKSHSKILEKSGMSKEQIHESLRIAAILNSAI